MNVKAYFERIGLETPEEIRPTSELLRKLHLAHCTAVPYENLDMLRVIPTSLEVEPLYRKIVEGHRGGLCFELNGLFGALLRELGYGVTDLAARYLRGESVLPMRRHRVLRVQALDGLWLCDVGIGEICPREPVALLEGVVQKQFGEQYKLEKEPFLGWVLWDLHRGEWRRFYSFTEEPQLVVDYMAPNFYCEQHPDSPFNKSEMFSLKTLQGRITLDGCIFKEFRGEKVVVREIKPEEKSEIYRKFGL